MMDGIISLSVEDVALAAKLHPKCVFVDISNSTFCWVQRLSGEVAFQIGSAPGIGMYFKPSDARAFATAILAQCDAIEAEAAP